LKTIEGNLYLQGDTIGGGSLTGAILGHLKKGYRVVMDESSAYSIRNDLDEVRSMGIEVAVEPPSGGYHKLDIQEIDLDLYRNFLLKFGEDLNVDVIAVAIQDHGVAPKHVSDRVFRFQTMEAMLREDNRAESFHFVEHAIPGYYLRMRSAVRAIRRTSSIPVLVMDTAFSAVLGCMEEIRGPSLVANAGNGHTIAALIIDRRIEGLYEHHTHELTPEKLERDLMRFIHGELTRQEVLDAKGHGVITLKRFRGEVSVIVTGPHRDLFKGTSLKFIYAAPGGNTMMTGPMGLVRAALFRFGK